jgi:hypothetical protein
VDFKTQKSDFLERVLTIFIIFQKFLETTYVNKTPSLVPGNNSRSKGRNSISQFLESGFIVQTDFIVRYSAADNDRQRPTTTDNAKIISKVTLSRSIL